MIRSPFIATADMPTTCREFLTFTIPSDEMRMSEARAWADSQAMQWAEARKTEIVGTVEWRISEDTICALATVSVPPRAEPLRNPSLRRKHDPSGCDLCDQIAAFPRDWIAADVARDLGLSKSTVNRHRLSIDHEEPSA